MTDFVGGANDENRIRKLQKEREELQKQVEERKRKIAFETEASVKNINDKFSSHSDRIEEQFKKNTIGLVSSEQFRQTREALERLEKEKIEAEKKKENQKQKEKLNRNKLSFNFDDGDDDEEEEQKISNDEESDKDQKKDENSSENKNEFEKINESSSENNSINESEITQHSSKKLKICKNPFVNTSFLPDKERDEKVKEQIEQLKREWFEEQERIKNEKIDVTYSYWDGSGHRKMITAKKGTTIEQFLYLVQQDFKELRGTSVENLLFVKEDVIIPQVQIFI
eukprot:TRINITY_DN3403_c0_g1_i2.p1 TRINITY_DN3403_c0_g1~~TRINITY_DN3403_c0_g1_i2.p1  ORF type:complete len:283 (-),score=150.33 TRINITY_DN3403_c0_g1_i2:320-1168(-)